MYDFFYSEVWWMDTIWTGLITAGATIVAAIIAYQVSISKLLDRSEALLKEHEAREEEHSDLSKEHSDRSKEHKELSKENQEIKHILSDRTDQMLRTLSGVGRTVTSIKELAVEEKARQEMEYNSLDRSDQRIIDLLLESSKSITVLSEKFMRLNSDNQALQAQLERLEQRNQTLDAQVTELRDQNNRLTTENKSLRDQYNQMQKQKNRPTNFFRPGIDR